jgi:hypothetical protein
MKYWMMCGLIDESMELEDAGKVAEDGEETEDDEMDEDNG